MAQVRTKPANNSQRSLRAFRATSAPERTAHGSVPPAVRGLDEVESVARIGSYAIDIASGRWTSSKGCDAIFGIDAGFERSVESWASLIHPGDRDAMVTYFAEDVVSRGQPFDRQYRIVRTVGMAPEQIVGRRVEEVLPESSHASSSATTVEPSRNGGASAAPGNQARRQRDTGACQPRRAVR